MKAEMPLPKIFAVAALYYVTGKLGLLLAIPPGVATAVWPPSGVALAAALMWGNPIGPGIWLGSFVVNIGTLFDSSSVASTMVSLAVAGSIGAGSTLQAILGASLIRRGLGSIHPFGKVKHIARFVGLMMSSCLVASTLGTTSLVFGGNIPWSAYPTTWLTWWLGDLMGILVVTPLPLIWKKEWSVRLERPRVTELILLLVSLYAMSHLILAEGPFEGTHYLIIPFILWAALRFGQGIVVLSTLMVSGIFMWATIQHVGPFVLGTLNASLLLLQSFIGVNLLTGMVLAAAMTERRQTERYLRVQYEVAQILVKSATLQEATRGIFRTVCEKLGWPYGELWTVDHEAGVLRFASAWHVPPVRFPEFEILSQKITFLPGIDLPGRVFSSGQPAWIVDVRKDPNFPRASAALKEGLRGACAFPILRNGEVWGVFTFFDVAEQQPDKDVLQLMASIGSQISQFIEHMLAEAQVRRVVESVPNAILLVNRDGRITSANAQAEALFGYSREILIGQPVERLIPERFRAQHPGHRAVFAAHSSARPMGAGRELYGLHKDGREFPVEIGLNPIETEDGHLVLASIIDITERKRTEETIRKLSTPVLPVRPGLLILPLIGTMDQQRADQLGSHLLSGIRGHRAKVVVMDVTGVAVLDVAIVRQIVDLVESARLMGAQVIFTGMGKGFSEAILSAGIPLGAMVSVGDLQRGIEEAERLLGENNGLPPSALRSRPDAGARSKT